MRKTEGLLLRYIHSIKPATYAQLVRSHISRLQLSPPHLPVVHELVDLCGGDAGDDQTHRHDGETGQDLIPHVSEFHWRLEENSDHKQTALTQPRRFILLRG